MRFVTSCLCVLAMASLSVAATVYDTAAPDLDAWVVPDLNNENFDTLDLTVTSNDLNTDLDYVLSYTGYSSSGTLSFVSLSPAIPGIAPAILTYSDLTAGSGIDGGHVTMNWFAQDATPIFDTDTLATGGVGGWNTWLVTMETAAGDGAETRYASVAVPEPGTMTLASLGLLGILHPLRRRMKNRKA